MACMCLYVYECALHERWVYVLLRFLLELFLTYYLLEMLVYVLCYVSCLSLFSYLFVDNTAYGTTILFS